MAANHIHYDLKDLVETDMLEPLDKAAVDDVLSKPPFIPIPGIINLRDGGHEPFVRRGLVYRSGALSNLSALACKQLKDELGIKLIIDLRSEGEIKYSPDPVIEGVKNLHLTNTRQPSATELEKFLPEGGKKGYVELYEEILEIHKPSIKAAFEHLRDEGTPFLFHCTAGKDRTGVLAAVILGFAMTPPDVIASDYALTRVGLEPAKDALTAMLKMWRKEWNIDNPGTREYSQAKADFMLGTLEMVEEKYGGMDKYVKDELGFGDEEREKIRKVLQDLNK